MSKPVFSSKLFYVSLLLLLKRAFLSKICTCVNNMFMFAANRSSGHAVSQRVHSERADTPGTRAQLSDDLCNGYKSQSVPTHSYVPTIMVLKDHAPFT